MPGEHRSSAVNGEGDGVSVTPSTANGATVLVRFTEDPASWLTKVTPRSRLVGLIVIPGGEVPFPLTMTIWGLPGALSTMESVPERKPASVG
jgi:hypothetical protein